jgi:hypothetical protein
MLDVLVPVMIFLVVLVFYANIRYHRQTSDEPELLVASSSYDIEEVSRLKVPVVFKGAMQGSNSAGGELASHVSHGAHLLNSSTGVAAPIEGDLDSLPLGRHALLVDGYACPTVSDAGRPPLTVRVKRRALYLKKGSRTPCAWSLSVRTCICPVSSRVVCELLPPANVEGESSIRGAFSEIYVPTDTSSSLTTSLDPGDVLIVPQFWGWRLAGVTSTGVEVVSYHTVMSYLTCAPELVACDLRPTNSHDLSRATPAKKRVRWKDTL